MAKVKSRKRNTKATFSESMKLTPEEEAMLDRMVGESVEALNESMVASSKR